MRLQQKLNAIEGLYFTDSSGVVWRLTAAARQQAEQLVPDNPQLSLQDVLARIPVEEPLPIPTI